MGASGFAGVDVFGSGPHRFVEEARGVVVVPRLRLGTPVSGSVSLGAAEVGVVVRGRLVGPDQAGLAAQLGAIEGLLTDPATVGTLTGLSGESWPEMSFVRFERAGWDRASGGGFVDRGRVVSLAYVARFVRLAAL